MEHQELVESPRKRQKTEATAATDNEADVAVAAETSVPAENAQALKELEVGITEFVTADNEGFSGILKKRYTDFMVNEILPSGEVLHLRNVTAPNKQNAEEPSQPKEPAAEKEEPEPAKEEPPAEFKVSEEDNALLAEYLGAENAVQVINLHKLAMSSPKGRPSEFGKVTVVVTDRDLRTKIHQNLRRIFNSQLESSADGEGNLGISAAPNRFKRKPQQGKHGRGGRAADGGRMSWDELGGQYLHFTLYKENKDTMEVISFLARTMKTNPKNFQFAGTKDRRGVTAQRACVYRTQAERLVNINRTLRNAMLGDFEHQKGGLELGDLNGNEFVITLRESEVPGIDLKSDPQAAVAKTTELVQNALKNLHERGYFNYYGLQRFGAFTTRTDTIGVKILQDDFKGAVDALLYYAPHVLAAAQEGEASTSPISSDDKARAEAISIFQSTGSINDSLAKLPRKFSAETNIIRHLGKFKQDYLGALQTIPRNLRLMYVHAYQSLVWNHAASQRWRLYGDKVVEGDLVLVHEHRDKEAGNDEPAGNIDADGEIIIRPEGDDSAAAAQDMFERARALTAEEVASGKYSIFDVVLPQPGFDMVYPPNKMTDFYREFMASEKGGGLDPFNMRRKWKDASLSGSYRKLLSRMGGDYSVDAKLYAEDNEQFVQTDLEKLRGGDFNEKPAEVQGDKLAIVLKFQLGSSQYATMALRELTKGKIQEYKPDFGGGR